MNGFRRFEILEPSFVIRETSIFKPKPSFIFPTFVEEDADFDLGRFPMSFDVLDSVADLIQRQAARTITTDSYLKTLSERVSALELGFDRFANANKIKNQDRKYSLTAEINSPDKDGIDRKYKWTAEIKAGKKPDSNFKLIAEYKGKGKNAPISNTYTYKASTLPAKKKDEKKRGCAVAAKPRVIEIKDQQADQAALVLKQVGILAPISLLHLLETNLYFPPFFTLSKAFAKRAKKNGKGKKKELSPQDAAMMIQIRFRAYLIRRSQSLGALRELAVAKTKLKEMRALFNNFSYRRRIVHDAEERQKFSERIIVLLLTVDAIEGADVMVRAVRRSMVGELEAMLDVVDPQPAGKLRRTFDLPDGGIQQEIAAGVAEVVQMLHRDQTAFEVCL